MKRVVYVLVILKKKKWMSEKVFISGKKKIFGKTNC